MSDMPDRIFVDAKRRGTDWWVREADQDDMAHGYEWTEEYIRADKYAELEATIAETVEKAAFVDEMCKALGVTFEALVNDDSVKAALKEKDDE